MARTDYYVILEVERRAPHETIKLSYRRLARRYHPDQNQEDPLAEDRFKRVVEAWEVLGDPGRRAQYDMFGHGGRYPAMGPPNVQQVAVVREFLRQSGRAMRERMLRSKGKDLRLQVDLTLLEALRGGARVVEMPRLDYSGTEVVRRLAFDIPPGVADGHVLRWKGQGGPGRYGGESGDFYVTIRVQPHAIFFFAEAKLSVSVHLRPGELTDAFNASKTLSIPVPTPWGVRTADIPATVRDGAVVEMPYVGSMNRTGGRNALFVHVHLFPVAGTEDAQRAHTRARNALDAYVETLGKGRTT